MQFIKFNKVWEDDDSMLQLEFSVSNSQLMTIQDFYIYPDRFLSFATQTAGFFPKLGKGEVILEYGSEANPIYAYILFKVGYKNLGELDIEIKTNNNHLNKDKSENLKPAISHFFCAISNQQLNEFGEQLMKWAVDMEGEFIYQW